MFWSFRKCWNQYECRQKGIIDKNKGVLESDTKKKLPTVIKKSDVFNFQLDGMGHSDILADSNDELSKLLQTVKNSSKMIRSN